MRQVKSQIFTCDILLRASAGGEVTLETINGHVAAEHCGISANNPLNYEDTFSMINPRWY